MRLFILLPILFLMISCTNDPKKPNIEVIQDMMEQPALKAQDFSPHDREKSSMRVPPVGTWPRNVKPYLYKGQPDKSSQNKNPFAGDNSEDFRTMGKNNYQNFCTVCHGSGGAGDGPVAEKFVGVKPPSLLTDKIKNYSDGRIFHIITEGQGIMGTYIHQLPDEKARWSVVNYLRSLQKK